MKKKLYRSKKDKIVAGVCGGLADYFDLDPIIIRIIFVILAIWGGSGVMLYIVLAIIVPEEPRSKEKIKEASSKKTEEIIEENIENFGKEVETLAKKHSGTGEFFFGLVLLFLGISLLINNFFPIFNFFKLWPVVLIFLAFAVLFKGAKGSK